MKSEIGGQKYLACLLWLHFFFGESRITFAEKPGDDSRALFGTWKEKDVMDHKAKRRKEYLLELMKVEAASGLNDSQSPGKPNNRLKLYSSYLESTEKSSIKGWLIYR